MPQAAPAPPEQYDSLSLTLNPKNKVNPKPSASGSEASMDSTLLVERLQQALMLPAKQAQHCLSKVILITSWLLAPPQIFKALPARGIGALQRRHRVPGGGCSKALVLKSKRSFPAASCR